MMSDELPHASSCLPQPSAVLDRLIDEFLLDIRMWAGLHIVDQRDPGERVVSYGYHWHEPDERGTCDNLTVYGYPTPLVAFSAGLQAKLKSDQRADTRDVCENRLITRCKIQE
jgi:hypothetical protein